MFYRNKKSLLSIEKIINLLYESKKITFLTGAGISAASGVPTFRGRNGFWTLGSITILIVNNQKDEKYNVYKVLTKKYLLIDPLYCWSFHRDLQNLLKSKKPNKSHFGISMLQRCFNKKNGYQVNLITQNVDNLHIESSQLKTNEIGFVRNIYQIHGNINYMRCLNNCSKELQVVPDLNQQLIPNCQKCGEKARPHALLFDEKYDETNYQKESALKAFRKSAALVVIGTDLKTSLPYKIVNEAIIENKLIIEINPIPKIKKGNVIWIQEKAEDIVPNICMKLLKKIV